MPSALAHHCHHFGYRLRVAVTLWLLAGGAAASTLPEVRVQAGALAPTEDRAAYMGTAASSTATGLALKAQQTPQPVQTLPRSLLNDQAVQTVQDVALLSAGLTVSRGQLYARGFPLGHWMLDGVGVSFDHHFDVGQNLALYDRVEVVQGATGLMQGLGNPSASMNLVRKQPTAQPRLALQLRAGSWQQRGVMMDGAGPLNAARTLRARWVVDAQNQHSFRDQVAQRQRSYYGVVEADVAEQTTLRLGASQESRHRRDSFSALPTAPDGGDLGLPRSTYLGYDWEYWHQRTNSVFAQLESEWANGWQLRADALQLRSRLDYLGTYLEGDAGALAQSLGQFAYIQRQASYALSLRGPWMFAGRSHQLALGLSHRRWNAAGQGWSLPGWRNGVSVHALHAEPQPLPPLALLQTYAYQYRQTLAPTQTGAWLAAQLQLAERWQLILGSRWERYRHQEEVGDNYRAPQSLDRRRDRHHSRYAALVWALDARHSAYLHSSDSFLPGSQRDAAGQVLPAATGRTLGAGVQGQYRDQRLQVGLHLFQTTQRNAPEQEDDQTTCPTWPGVSCYRAIDQVRSRGVLVQVQGQINPRWEVSASYTWADNRYARDALKPDQRFEPQLPRQQWQLATVYRLPDSPWRIGASVYWQSAIANAGLASASAQRYHIRQSGYTLVGAMAAYQIAPQWQLQVNVRNMLDRRYYQSIESPAYTSYGAPRSVQMVLGYRY